MRDHLRRLGGPALALAVLIAVGAAWPSLAQIGSQLDQERAGGRQRLTANSYVFKVGILQRDNLGRWVLSDGTPLRTDDETVWVDETSRNAEAYPIEGRPVRLMGQMGPGGFTVRHGVLRDQVEAAQQVSTAMEAEPDTPEPIRPR